MRRSTRERDRSVVLLSAAALLIVLPALGVLGTFLHGVPHIGMASAFVPWFLPWLIVVGVLTIAGASIITARMTAAVEHAGAEGSPRQFPQRYAAITSATHISGAAPPTLILVGEADHLVPAAGVYRFTDQAREAGVDVELVAVPYADHVFDARPGSIGQQAYRQLTARWLRSHGQAP